MIFLPWKAEYNTGIKEIDIQHQQLVDMINELNAAIQTGNSQETLQNIFSDLLVYAIRHFDAEEELMDKLGCVNLEEHKAKHQEFKNQIETMLKHYIDEKPRTEEILLTYLQSWLSNHILIHDKGAFI